MYTVAMKPFNLLLSEALRIRLERQAASEHECSAVLARRFIYDGLKRVESKSLKGKKDKTNV
jgi:hypothetical protein